MELAFECGFVPRALTSVIMASSWLAYRSKQLKKQQKELVKSR